MLCEVGAAAFVGLPVARFRRAVDHGELPQPRRLVGLDRRSRNELVRLLDPGAGVLLAGDHHSITAAIVAARHVRLPPDEFELCDRVAVMYLGRVVEEGPVRSVLRQPKHPYTQRLMAAIPNVGPRVRRERVVLEGDVPSPFATPKGCRFVTRCPCAHETCRRAEPELCWWKRGGACAATSMARSRRRLKRKPSRQLRTEAHRG